MKCTWTNVVIHKNLTQTDRKNVEKAITQSDFPPGLKNRGRREGRAFILTVYFIIFPSRKMDL